MDRSDVTQIVLEAYDNRWRGDLAGTLACFHPDVRITILGDPAVVPFAGRYQGLDGLKTYLDRLDAQARPVAPTLEDLIVDGDRAVVSWTMPIRTASATDDAKLRFIDVVCLDSDLIVAVDQFHDTAAAAALFGDDLGRSAAA
jgi:ketosteroid isomerase-like protein